jgi:hypothetical protein
MIVVGLGLDSVYHPSDEARNILVSAIHIPQVKLLIAFGLIVRIAMALLHY